MAFKIFKNTPLWPSEGARGVWLTPIPGGTDNFEANLDDPKRNGRGTAKLPITQDANIIIFTIF